MDLPLPVEPVLFPGPNRSSLPGFIVGPPWKPPGSPGLVLVQEWWGVTDVVKQQVRASTPGAYMHAPRAAALRKAKPTSVWCTVRSCPWRVGARYAW